MQAQKCLTSSLNITDSQSPSLAVDRLWVFWRKAGTGIGSSTIYYKTYRVGVDLSQLNDNSGNPAQPILWDQPTAANPTPSLDNVTVSNNHGPFEVDRTGTKIYFTEADERYKSMAAGAADALGLPVNGSGEATGVPQPMTITYKNINGNTQTVTLDDVYWLNGLPDQSLASMAVQGNVNEDSIYAFADPGDIISGTLQSPLSSKIWVFWTTPPAAPPIYSGRRSARASRLSDDSRVMGVRCWVLGKGYALVGASPGPHYAARVSGKGFPETT